MQGHWRALRPSGPTTAQALRPPATPNAGDVPHQSEQLVSNLADVKPPSGGEGCPSRVPLLALCPDFVRQRAHGVVNVSPAPTRSSWGRNTRLAESSITWPI